MIRIFLITFTCVLLFNCQNTSAPIPQKPTKLEKNVVKSKTKDNEVYNTRAVNVIPKFPGGIEKFYAFVKKNYVIPKGLNEEDSSTGGVFPTIKIEKDGSLSEIKILRDIGYGSGKELERVLKLCPNWIPAIKDGNPVRCLYSIPYYIH